MSTSRSRRLAASLVFAVTAAIATPCLAAVGDITLVGQLTLPNTVRITDVWGYRDGQGHQYAIVGDWTAGVYIVDVTVPSNPSYVTKVIGVPGFDVKVYDHYVYTCDGNASGTDSRIIDIADVSAPVVLPNAFLSCHNITITDGGTMFLEYLGLTSFDLSTDPAAPDSLWHNNSNGHDCTPRGNLLYDFSGYDASMTIWDITDPAAPSVVSTITDPAINYYHSGDASKDGDYLYICDELSTDPEPDIIVWDISNPASPSRVGDLAEPTATVHNLYVVGDLAFVSYYTAGFRTLDLSNPAAPSVLDTYDTSAYSGEGYDGAFGVYPYADGGLVFISDHPNGLFVFSVEGYNGQPTAAGDTPTATATLQQNVPNPFNPRTTIAFSLDTAGSATLEVYDVRGAKVRTLVDGVRSAGAQQVEWDGRDDAGRAVASGVYYYRLRSGTTTLSRKMVLLK